MGGSGGYRQGKQRAEGGVTGEEGFVLGMESRSLKGGE